MINSRDIKDLHPTLKRGVEELLRRCKEKGLPVLITSTYRDNEYQNMLFNQRPIVTKLRGGQSLHNHRLAFDFCKNIKGQEFKDIAFFEAVGKIWTEMGGEWGGHWTNPVDRPHCQFTNGRTVSDISSKKYVMPNDVKMKWEMSTGNSTTTNKEEKKYMLRDLKVLMENKEQTVSAILEKEENYVRLRDLDKMELKISYDENKKMPVIEKLNSPKDTKVLFDGEEKTVSSILDAGTNYIKLRDLEKLGFKVSWDETNKMPVIEK